MSEPLAISDDHELTTQEREDLEAQEVGFEDVFRMWKAVLG